jgi:hypothetical protein
LATTKRKRKPSRRRPDQSPNLLLDGFLVQRNRQQSLLQAAADHQSRRHFKGKKTKKTDSPLKKTSVIYVIMVTDFNRRFLLPKWLAKLPTKTSRACVKTILRKKRCGECPSRSPRRVAHILNGPASLDCNQIRDISPLAAALATNTSLTTLE